MELVELPSLLGTAAVSPADREQVWKAYQTAKARDAARLYDEHGIITAADFFEYCVDHHPDALAVKAVDAPAQYTYTELDRTACQVAHWATAQGLAQGDVVALLMENRPEFLAVTMGMAKVGITIALLNINLTSGLLAHAVTVAAAKHVLATAATASHWHTAAALVAERAKADGVILPAVTWFDVGTGKDGEPTSLLALLPTLPTVRPDRTTARGTIKPRDPLYYIYTSGTTGPSKAARFSHLRFIGCALTWARPCGLRSGDRYYVTLPLYHGNAGCVAVAAAYYAGATVVLRRKFSASAFLPEIVQHRCTAVAYIGELWRYLQLQPPSPLDRQHAIRVIVGNGLRTATWRDVVARFAIPLVVEHYGSTEMPGDAVLNYFNVPGSCGYVPLAIWADRDAKIVAYDVAAEAVVRDQAGHCVECAPGEAGEIIFKLPGGTYDGYVGREATLRKLYQNVFMPGDTWWSSGDLLRMDADGFFYFVDRTGDTFRWKGENVSTNDVCSVLQTHAAVAEANVYGVPVAGNEGRAGMAAITTTAGVVLDAAALASLSSHISEHLPSYARPQFLRVRTSEHPACGVAGWIQSAKTSTFKFQKHVYAQDGFDPARVGGDALYFCDRSQPTVAYIPLDAPLYSNICAGAVRL